jgi:ATP-dependent protease HslVU (ClpYQ) peptidase subunit
MSIIAWDGKSIVADKMAVCCGMQSIITKLFKLDHWKVIGVVGDLAQGLILIEWYKGGMDKDAWPEFQKGDDFTYLIVADSKGVVFYEQQPIAVQIEDDFHAWGSGRDFAMAAMYMGADAKKAVEAACHFDVNCGNGIDEFVLNE